jgi:predicted transcriptional regulator
MTEATEHETREILLEHIRDRPGIAFSRLMSLLDLNEGTLRYHLNYLERKELVVSKKEGVKRVYFTSHLSNIGPAWRADLTKDQNRVLCLIRKHPGIKPREILASTELSRNGLRNIIVKLKKEHMIWEVENGSGPGYELITRERLIEEMLLDLVDRFLNGEIDQSTFLHLKEWIEGKQENN